MKTIKNWYIEVTADNLAELDKWRKENAEECLDWELRVGSFVLSRHLYDKSLFCIGKRSLDYANQKAKKITIEQFREITNTNKTMAKLSKETAQEMYASGVPSIMQFAVDNYPELGKKEWFEELEKGKYYVDYHCKLGFITKALSISQFSQPNYTFITKAKADLFAQKITLFQEMTRFAELRNGDWFADFDNDEYKFGIIAEGNNYIIFNYMQFNAFIFGIAVKSKEIAEEMLEIFGERLKIYNL